jgi:hypothetical protein
MTNLAFKRVHFQPTYRVGSVAVVEGRAITVHTDDEEICAERAVSCLVPPRAGDEVAVIRTGDGRAFVVAVLVGTDAHRTEIAVPGDLQISAEGSCRIAAADAVELSSEDGTVSVAARVLLLRAVEGTILLSGLTLLASTVLAHTDTARVAAKAFDWVCDRLCSTVERSYRKVTELDQLCAERIDYRTEQEMCLRSENFLVGARTLAKLDAEQIHIG